MAKEKYGDGVDGVRLSKKDSVPVFAPEIVFRPAINDLGEAKFPPLLQPFINVDDDMTGGNQKPHALNGHDESREGETARCTLCTLFGIFPSNGHTVPPDPMKKLIVPILFVGFSHISPF
jgi:hypothetical protein